MGHDPVTRGLLRVKSFPHAIRRVDSGPLDGSGYLSDATPHVQPTTGRAWVVRSFAGGWGTEPDAGERSGVAAPVHTLIRLKVPGESVWCS